MQQKILFLACSFFLLSCSGIERPKGYINVIDANYSRKLSMDLEKDFDENGQLKKDVQWKIQENVSLKDFDKHVSFDPDSWASVVTYIRTLRSEYERLKKECH